MNSFPDRHENRYRPLATNNLLKTFIVLSESFVIFLRHDYQDFTPFCALPTKKCPVLWLVVLCQDLGVVSNESARQE